MGQGRGGGCVEGSEHGEKNGTGRGLCEAVKEEVGSITAIKKAQRSGFTKKGQVQRGLKCIRSSRFSPPTPEDPQVLSLTLDVSVLL